MKVLVIEDDPVVREEVVAWLSFEGYDVVSGANGVQGRDLAFSELPDVIVSDISMPGLSGHELLVEIRENPQTSHIPFIFMTARTARSDVRHGMELGAEDYITKPFSHEELLGAVRIQLAKLGAERDRTSKQLDELRSVFTHTLPHELRTPLTVIMGYGESLASGVETLPRERIALMAQRILESGERLKRLVENYLTYAQIESIRHDPRRAAAMRAGACTQEPDALIADIANKFAYLYGRSGDLVLALNAGVSVDMLAEDLSKSVHELMDNAFKFSPPATEVRVSSEAHDGLYQLRITNRGEGMTPEQVQQIGAFSQFDREFKEQQGLGLGIAIAKGMVELFNGHLTVESELLGATTMTITLPRSP